jgi:GGDEF domain-containing protein
LIETRPFDTPSGPLNISMSLGIAGTNDWPGLTGEPLIREADVALYRAKESGRNCAFVARPNGLEPAVPERQKKGPIPA